MPGSLAIFTAIRRASSLLSSLAAESPPFVFRAVQKITSISVCVGRDDQEIGHGSKSHCTDRPKRSRSERNHYRVARTEQSATKRKHR
jgi:hypothetical protein